MYISHFCSLCDLDSVNVDSVNVGNLSPLWFNWELSASGKVPRDGRQRTASLDINANDCYLISGPVSGRLSDL